MASKTLMQQKLKSQEELASYKANLQRLAERREQLMVRLPLPPSLGPLLPATRLRNLLAIAISSSVRPCSSQARRAAVAAKTQQAEAAQAELSQAQATILRARQAQTELSQQLALSHTTHTQGELEYAQCVSMQLDASVSWRLEGLSDIGLQLSFTHEALPSTELSLGLTYSTEQDGSVVSDVQLSSQVSAPSPAEAVSSAS